MGKASKGGVVEVSSGGVGSSWRDDVGLVFAKPPVDAGGGAIGALVKPVVDARAPTAGKFPTLVLEGALARPPVEAFERKPMVRIYDSHS